MKAKDIIKALTAGNAVIVMTTDRKAVYCDLCDNAGADSLRRTLTGMAIGYYAGTGVLPMTAEYHLTAQGKVGRAVCNYSERRASRIPGEVVKAVERLREGRTAL